MGPGTRLSRETRRQNFEPASSAGSHDTISTNSDSFVAPPRDITIDSILSDITNPEAESFSYIPPPAIRPSAPTPDDFSILLPSSRAPSSCDFGTPKAFSYSPPSVFQPSPPLMSKTRERAPYQARCESASPSDDSLSRFFKGYSSSSTSSARPRMEPNADESGDRTASSHAPAVDSSTIDLPAIYQSRAQAPIIRHPNIYANISSSTVDPLDDNTPVLNSLTIEASRVDEATIDAFTSWSLFALNDHHLADFVSGALKFGELDQNGKPVFVKHRKSQRASDTHKDVDALHISQEEDDIIVSMDQLRKEIAELQEHDEAMEREADKLHKEKAKLELQLQEARSSYRKSSTDSAIGSDSDSDMRKRVQADKVKRMQRRLEEANALVNTHEVHINALTAERDSLANDCRFAYEEVDSLKATVEQLKEQLSPLPVVQDELELFVKHVQRLEQEKVDQRNQLLKRIGRLEQEKAEQREVLVNHIERLSQEKTEEHDQVLKHIQRLEQEKGDQRDLSKRHLRRLEQENVDTRDLLTKRIQRLEQEKSGLQQTTLKDMNFEKELGQMKAANQHLRQQNEHLLEQNRALRQTRKSTSEQIKNLQAELSTTQEQLGESLKDIQVLLQKHNATKAQRDRLKESLESLQQEYTVIRHKLRAESTMESVSSIQIQPRPSRPTPVQAKRPGPAAASRFVDEEDNTMRPAFDAAENMRVLISATESEMAQLQRSIEAKATEYNSMNKGYKRRTWETLHREKLELEKQLHEKSRILYRQYDMLEDLRKRGRA
ncbi:hypothetical protein VMCG_03610 [Cytospora schulzeri]|uniref:PPC89 centrosome localisation domain-containing protein n=1 Tax=Cytospora schulzeri TaxID=448051 RepID=A0A423WW65_9PEZI|nr:hypothetical protein VMCG_03610 [Valsa malicola]